MLYIVASAIGNLDDLSIRQAKTLIESEIILAEDTRSAYTLLEAIEKRFGLKRNQQNIISYYKEREFEKLPEVMEWLKEDKNIALLSESGTPLVSDPGYLLVKTAIKEKIPITVIPGPTALITGLVYSGFNPSQFTFLGFIPKKESEKKKLIKKLQEVKKIFPDMSFGFYESAQRIEETLDLIIETGWNPDVAICREMTKKFEEIIRAKADKIQKGNLRGEITLFIG